MKTLITLLVFGLSSVSWAQSSPVAGDLEKEIAATRYKLATLLATARVQNKVCDVEAYVTALVDVLNGALGLDPDLRSKAASESVFRQTLNSNLVYRETIGELDHRWNGLEKALSEAVFYGPARGAYGNTIRYEFKPNGKMTVHTLELLDEEPWWRWNSTQGRWTLSITSTGKPQVVISYGENKTTYTLEKTFEWGTDYRLTPLEQEKDQDIVTNSPSECEA
jgi:hypothetical protein